MKDAESILKEALELPVDERIRVALQLMDSIDDRSPHADAEEAWTAEIERRMAALEAGTAKTMSAREAIERARERLRQNKK